MDACRAAAVFSLNLERGDAMELITIAKILTALYTAFCFGMAIEIALGV